MIEAIKRNYSLTDADLCMFTSNLVGFLTRDAAEFLLKDVSTIDITDLESMGDTFETFPKDSYFLSDVMIAVAAKNEDRKLCEKMMRSIVGCGKILWGDRSPQVKRFNIGKMTKTNDREFLTLARQVALVAGDYLTELAAKGLTQAMIDELNAESQSFEDELNNISEKESIRDIKTQERAASGNDLYEYVANYCEIGKIIWQDVDEAKYNDYVIYKSTSSGLGKVKELAFDDVSKQFSWDILPGSLKYQLEEKASGAGAEWAVIYEDSATIFDHDPGAGTWYFRCRGWDPEGYGDWSDELEVVLV